MRSATAFSDVATLACTTMTDESTAQYAGGSFRTCPSANVMTPASVVRRASRRARPVMGTPGALFAQARIQEITQPVAEQVGAKHHQRDRHAGDGGQPPGVGEIVAPLGEH